MTRRDRAPQINLPELRQEITDLVARNALAMVQCAIDGVMEESQYQAIKYLFEMVGIYPACAEASEGSEDTLSKVLLRNLGVGATVQSEESGPDRDVQIHPVE